MDLKTNGAITQSWRTTIPGVLSAASLIAYAVAEAAGAHPSIKLWALVVGGVFAAITAALAGDHVRFFAEVKSLAKAVAELRAMVAQAEAVKGRISPPPAAPIPELDVPISREPASPQDTIPEAPPVVVPVEPAKEPR